MRSVFTLLLTLVFCSGFAQQDPQYTQYLFNPLSVNSAYAGSHDALSVALLAREQWMGMPGRPRTQAVSAHLPLGNPALALGFSAISDQHGPVKSSQMATDFALRTPLNDRTRIALGIKTSVTLYHIALAELENTDPTDLAFAQNLNGSAHPNIGASLYVWNAHRYIGVSAPRLVENKLAAKDEFGFTGTEKRHLFVYGGMVLGEYRRIQFKPTFQLKAVAGAPVSWDFTAQFLFARRLWLGGMVRPGAAWGVLTSYRILEECSVGYAFDHPTTALYTYQSATHEIALMFHFGFTQNAFISPRYF